MAPSKASPKKRGRPKKELAHGDDGKPHRIYDVTDFALYDSDGNIVPERLQMWTYLAREDCSRKCKVAGEECPNTLKWHGQARISFICPHRRDYVIKMFGKSHVEITIATDDWSYFHKWESVLLIDEDHKTQGKRVIFSQQLQAIKNGATLSDCFDMEGANYQSVRSAEVALYYKEPLRPVAPRETILIQSIDDVPFDAYRVSGRYWDGYDAHPVIYINQAKLNYTYIELSEITGRQPFRLGGRYNRSARHDKVYIYGLSEFDYSHLIDI